MRTSLALAFILLVSITVGAAEPSPLGQWITEGGKARVRIEPCTAGGTELCGVISWSYRPEAATEGPLLDVNNSDPALRSRPIIGLPLMQGFRPAGPSRWDNGTIYDPEGAKRTRQR